VFLDVADYTSAVLFGMALVAMANGSLMQEVTITAQVLYCWLEHRGLGRDYRFLDCIHDGPSEKLRRRPKMEADMQSF